MLDDLQLMTSAGFGEVQCDFYQQGNDFYMTREQIGASLEYNDPRGAISDMY